MKNDGKILNAIKIIFLVLVLTAGIQYASAQNWSPPTQAPPAGNTSAPLNAGAIGQVKAGGLQLGSGFDNPTNCFGGYCIALGILNGYLKIDNGAYLKIDKDASEGRVLTSDATGVATWRTGGSGNLPTGTTSQTLRHNGTTWVADSNIFNNGTNVGIGTTAQTAKLNVNGDVNIVSGCYRVAGNCIGKVSGTGSQNYVPKWTNTSTLSTTSNIYDNGTKVGIGTTEPRATLHVTNVAGGDSNGLIRISKPADSGNSTLQLYKGSGTSWKGWAFVNNPQGDLEINYDGSENTMTKTPIFITGGSDPFVGIGTSAINPPEYRLHVANGSIYLDTAEKGIIMKSTDGSCYRLTMVGNVLTPSSGFSCL